MKSPVFDSPHRPGSLSEHKRWPEVPEKGGLIGEKKVLLMRRTKNSHYQLN